MAKEFTVLTDTFSQHVIDFNGLVNKVGDLSNLNTTADSDLVSAINELVADNVSDSDAIINLGNKVGDLSNLNTTADSDLVSAINELVADNVSDSDAIINLGNTLTSRIEALEDIEPWTADNDGDSSGLDADLLGGIANDDFYHGGKANSYIRMGGSPSNADGISYAETGNIFRFLGDAANDSSTDVGFSVIETSRISLKSSSDASPSSTNHALEIGDLTSDTWMKMDTNEIVYSNSTTGENNFTFRQIQEALTITGPDTFSFVPISSEGNATVAATSINNDPASLYLKIVTIAGISTISGEVRFDFSDSDFPCFSFNNSNQGSSIRFDVGNAGIRTGAFSTIDTTITDFKYSTIVDLDVYGFKHVIVPAYYDVQSDGEVRVTMEDIRHLEDSSVTPDQLTVPFSFNCILT